MARRFPFARTKCTNGRAFSGSREWGHRRSLPPPGYAWRDRVSPAEPSTLYLGIRAGRKIGNAGGAPSPAVTKDPGETKSSQEMNLAFKRLLEQVMASDRKKKILMVMLLLVSLVIYGDLSRLDAANGWGPVLQFLRDMAGLFIAYWIAFRLVQLGGKTSRFMVALILCGALLFRIALLPAGLNRQPGSPGAGQALKADIAGQRVAFDRFLLFDCDVWRYLWDGHVWSHGYNPYRRPPSDPVLDRFASEEPTPTTDGLSVWGDIRGNIHYHSLPTVYPPAAQVLFRLSHFFAPSSVLAMKLLIVCLDLGTLGLIMIGLHATGLPVSHVILYAWNPLVVKVFAGSAHYDSLLTLLLSGVALAIILGWHRLAAVLLGMSILTKLAPVVLVPFLYRRAGWRSVVLCGSVVLLGLSLAFQPNAQSLAGFAEFGGNWRFNAGPYALLESMARFLHPAGAATAARILSAVFILTGLVALRRRDRGGPEDFSSFAAWALGLVLLFSPVVNPWYVTWTLPYAVLSRRHEWLWMSALICLAFLVMVEGREFSWALWIEYGSLLAIMVCDMWRRGVIYTSFEKGVRFA